MAIPATIFFFVLAAILLRTGFVRLGSAIVCALFGFFLASTGIAPTVNHAVASVIDWANSLVH